MKTVKVYFDADKSEKIEQAFSRVLLDYPRFTNMEIKLSRKILEFKIKEGKK